jgi:short-chain fatty acids transporter
MKIADKYTSLFQKYLPSPFAIAILLTVVALIGSIIFSDKDLADHFIAWQNGLWEPNLLVFAFQMMLMLVLGHVLALSNFFNSVMHVILKPIKTNATAVATVAFFTILVSFFNWGLSLIFGAILARKVGEKFTTNSLPLNYPLVGAAGFSGLMTWHGGLSGSAPLKAAESGHLNTLTNSTIYPDAISLSETVFSSMNLVVFGLLLSVIPFMLYRKAKNSHSKIPELTIHNIKPSYNQSAKGAERIDQMWGLSKGLGIAMVALALHIAVTSGGRALSFLTPNFINFCLLAGCFWLHKNFTTFLNAVDEAISGAAGILIQFPLYFGILALLQSGGLIDVLSNTFIAISNTTTLPLLTVMSAGIVNIFVPSGGGQWAIQGPILLNAAAEVGVPLHKIIMAMAYGDELTNMLQPFWALPLLSITGLKAKELLPYTMYILLIGVIIFIAGLLLF